MSPALTSLEIELPAHWDQVEEPADGAAIQALGPADGGFRSVLTIDVHPRVDAGEGDAHVGPFHDGRLNELAQTMTDALVIDDAEVEVSGSYARTSSIVFRQGPFTVTSRVWTIQGPDVAIVVSFMCDADRFMVEGPAMADALASLCIESDQGA